MCGISIIVKGRGKQISPNLIYKMNDIIEHRGPDGKGAKLFLGSEKKDNVANETDWNVALGHRRLSIIDLTSGGHQPMQYHNRYWITFNGEIYNYIEIRKELRGAGFKFITQSDTEVILAAYTYWGNDCFKRFNGMWSLGIYDQLKKELILSRDRMGIKPMYFYHKDDLLLVGSEIKQLKEYGGLKRKINEPVLSEYLNTGYEAHNQTFFENIIPLDPGTFAVFEVSEMSFTEKKSYWNPTCSKTIKDPKEADQAFFDILDSSVKLRMRSDVPVGSFLSGGLDSSSVVSLMRDHSNPSDQINTFSAVFSGFKMDEKVYVDEVLNHIPNLKGSFITPTFETFKDNYEKMIWHNDEPVGGPSVFASFTVAELAHKHKTKVILNGQGGDEILGGYWQMYYLYLFNKMKSGNFGTVFKNGLGALLPSGNGNLIRNFPFIAKRYLARKKSTNLKLNLGRNSNESYLQEYLNLSDDERRVNDIRFLFLPRLLKWEDKNTMAFSIEGRYPFLDYRLIELCLSLSDNVLYDNGWTKMPLRRSLKNKLPISILKRKTKYGFEVPQNEWLLKLLKDDLLTKTENPIYSIIQKKEIISLIDEFRKNRDNNIAQVLFRLLFTNTWMKQNNFN